MMPNPDPRYLTEIDGVPVPLNVAGLPDSNTMLGLAASLLPQADASDADARGWQDATNATGTVTLSTYTLRRLIAAAIAQEVADARTATSGIAPAVRFHTSETRDGETTLQDPVGYSKAKHAAEDSRTYNAEEVELSLTDEVVYGVVKATTTYETVDTDQEA